MRVVVGFMILMITLLDGPPAHGDEPPPWLHTWGTSGSGDGQFNTPRGIAIDSAGFVYVSDRSNHRIQRFTAGGVFTLKWGVQGTGDGQLKNPHGIAVGSDGNVYVADTGNHRIQKFTPLGAFILKWGSSGSAAGQFNSPAELEVDRSGNVLVVDWGNRRIQKFTGEGAFLMTWGSPGSGNGQFLGPYGVAVDDSDYVYVTDGSNNDIQKFTSDGVYILQWGASGGIDGWFRGASGIAMSPDNKVYVTDSGNSRIQKFTSTGDFLTKWGEGGSTNGNFYDPAGIAVNDQDLVYVVDYFLNRVQIFSPLPDTIPPSSVSDLHVTGWTETSVTLGWSAPGDDGTVGRSTTYDIRYSTSPINGENFEAADPATGEPQPGIGGSQDSHELGGLQFGVFYYFALRSSDDAGNMSGVSNMTMTTTQDLVPPGAVTDLLITGVSTSAAGLSWTAPGDNGSTGTAATYDVRYSTQPITDLTFATRPQAFGEPVPGPAGTHQTMNVAGLSQGTKYYFALKVQDEVPNVSAISNVPNATTLTAPATNQNARILLHLAAPVTKNACAPGFIPCADAVTTAPAGGTTFAYVLVGDASSNAGVGGVQFGILYDGVSGHGVDVFGWSSCGSGSAGDSGWPGSGTGNLVLWEADSSCQRGVPGVNGTSVVAVAGYFYIGTYGTDVLRLTPRPATGSAAVVDCDGAEVVLEGVGVNPVPSRLGYATFSNSGTPGYNPCDPAPTAVPEEAPKASRLLAAPNPFSSRTMILFQMTTPAVVELTVFDASGRRVRELMNEPRGTGDHAVAWDGRDDRGERLPHGIYFARLSLNGEPAGAYRIAITRS